MPVDINVTWTGGDVVEAQPGYVWLDLPGKVRHISERDLAITDKPRFGGKPTSP